MLAEAVKGFSGDTQIPQSNNMGVSGFLKVGGGAIVPPAPQFCLTLASERGESNKTNGKDVSHKAPLTRVLYISSSIWLLQVIAGDFSQAEKERTSCKAEKIHKMTTIFTQKS